MGAIILMKTRGAVVRPKQRTLNWYVLSLPRSEDNDANRDEQEPAGRRPAGPERPSSRLGEWNGLTMESPCGNETRYIVE